MYAFVLSRRDFRENDQIISLYTAEKGKTEVLARGVKKITSKNAAFLEPCFLVEAEIISGKEFWRLTKVQSIKSYRKVRADLEKILLAGKAVKLLDDLLEPGESDKNIFSLLKNFLDYLEVSPAAHSSSLDIFVVKLFRFLGFDIAYSEKKSPSFGRIFHKISAGDFDCLAGLNELELRVIHREIYNFATHHSEQKLAYFGKFDKI